MKEFNLEEYLKNPSQKVITRDGREVRIICTDMKSIYKIVVLVYNKKSETESLLIYKENGKYYFEESTNDLFFAPTKKEGWINLYKDSSGVYPSNFIFENEKDAKEVIGDKHTYLTTIKIEWEE